MSRRMVRCLALLLALVLLGAACSSNGNAGSSGSDTTKPATTKAVDYKAVGLWDDGPCDASRKPLKIGLITAFESPVISLKDQADALQASATAFNKRGGANGACIKVFTCDDGANTDQAVGCAREVDKDGVVATVNDQVTSGQGEVSPALAKAGIARIAANVVPDDWGDQNAYPLDASGTGSTFMLPQALIAAGAKKIGIIRVDIAAASALIGLLGGLYKGKATFPVDLPVPGGTTDFSQFILAAQKGGADGVGLALGEQEAVQVVRAGQQLGTKLVIGSTLGTYSHSTTAELGDFAKKMSFVWSFPPATYDLPVYQALRADLAASGEKELQPDNLKASAMRSWIGLYATLWMIRQSGMKDFTREGISAMLKAAKDVPMLDIFGGENWTPDTNHPGVFKRAGMNYWAVWKWDPAAKAPDGLKGNFVKTAEVSFDKVLCGSPLGAPGPC